MAIQIKLGEIVVDVVLKEIPVSFDYYFIDAGWHNLTGDLTDFDPKLFPDGPKKIISKIKDLNMKFGLWLSPSGGPNAFHPEVIHPTLSSCYSLPTINYSDNERKEKLENGE